MLTHVDPANRPMMVDVGEKAVTRRMASARAVVVFPPEMALNTGETLRTKKGPVFDTAIVAGVMAAKRTHELIPFCHPIPLEDCQVWIDWRGDREVVIECTVRATHKTGVEMEALMGATTAALTIYDMCKALGHGIVIRDVVLIEKNDPSFSGPSAYAVYGISLGQITVAAELRARLMYFVSGSFTAGLSFAFNDSWSVVVEGGARYLQGAPFVPDGAIQPKVAAGVRLAGKGFGFLLGADYVGIEDPMFPALPIIPVADLYWSFQ